MKLPNTPDTADGARPPLDAHEALLRRGYCWEPCFCDRGRQVLAWGSRRCPECFGEGGRYVVEPASISLRKENAGG